jgi:translation initiation factor 2B subunit (eIF-2B alpha/beta/delta family)
MTRLAPILLCLLALGLAACGDDDDAPTREDFADRANEICRDARQALENVSEEAETPEEIAAAVDRVIEESRATVDELGELEPPEGEAGEIAERFVDTTRTEIEERGIPVLEDLRDAVEDENEQAIREAVRRLQETDTDASNRAAEEIGANACAER